jgi:hypothetical protein
MQIQARQQGERRQGGAAGGDGRPEVGVLIFTKTDLWLQAAQCPGLEQNPFEAGGKRRRRDVVIGDLNGKSEWLPVARLTALTAVTCDDGMTPCRASTPLPPMLRSLTFGL